MAKKKQKMPPAFVPPVFVAQWDMPPVIRERCGAEHPVLFRLFDDDQKRIVVEVAQGYDCTGALQWAVMPPESFGNDIRPLIMLHCAALHIGALKEEMLEVNATALSQMAYIHALEYELANGKPPVNAEGVKPPKKRVAKKPK